MKKRPRSNLTPWPQSSRDDTITYGELEARANQLAHYLIENGIGPGSLVGVCLERSIYMPVALLAILKTGAGYVPMEAAYPRERVVFILESIQAKILYYQ